MTKSRDLANAATALNAVTATEIGYVDGVTSAIQTQLDAKQAVVSGVNDTEIGYLDGVTSAVQTQLNAKQAVVSGVNDTEIGYLDGVTSAIQTQLDAKTAKSTLSTTGDIYYASAANTPARLGIGSTGNVLTVAGGIPSWAAPAGGGGGGMTLIQESTASANSSLDFSSISGSYKQLLLVWHGIYASANGLAFAIRFNSSSASEYQTYHGGAAGSGGSGGYSGGQTTTTYVYYPDGGSFITESASSSVPTIGSLMIDNYASTSKHKFYEGRQFGMFSENSGVQSKFFGGTWKNTSAITSINVFRISASGTFTNNTNTSVRLYGIS